MAGTSTRKRFKHYSQFVYRYCFALLLFFYMQHQGITAGFMSQTQIALAMVAYVTAVAIIQYLARGQRLVDRLQRVLVILDLLALTVGVPHDPNRGLPTLFVFYLAYADLGLRYRFKLYVESLYIGGVAVGLMLYLRAQHTEAGLTPPDIWQVFLLSVIVLHGLQVFAGRDRARRRMQESERRLQLALETPGVAAWSTSDPLRQLKVDGQLRVALGMRDQEHLGPIAEYIERIHPEDRDRVVRRYTEFVHSEDTQYEDAYRVLHTSGEVLSVVSRAQAIRDKANRRPRVAGMLWDRTAQRRQEEALLRMEERYRLATHAARVGVWVWHIAEDRFEHDDALNQMFGLPPGGQAVPLAQVMRMMHPDDRDAFQQRLKAVLASDAQEYFEEVRIIARDSDRLYYIYCRGVIERDAAGQAVRMAGANLDVTRLTLARLALEEKTRELERSNQELDDFTYIASHDLKEPLRGVQNYANFLQQDYAERLDDEGRRMLGRIISQSQRMETLIQELLNVARLSRSEVQRERVDLNALMQDLQESLEYMLRENAVEFRLPAALPTLNCDRVRVRELFRNLITNAVKYNDKPQRWIEVSAESRDGECVLVVRDNGIGIPAEYRDQVFTLFERLHGRDDAFGGGTGVGLTIVHKTVQLHGGRIWIESEPGQGTAFCFTLPNES